MKATKGMFCTNFYISKKIGLHITKCGVGSATGQIQMKIFTLKSQLIIKRSSSRRKRTWTDDWLEETRTTYYNPFSVTCAGSEIYKIEILLPAVEWMIRYWCTSEELA